MNTNSRPNSQIARLFICLWLVLFIVHCCEANTTRQLPPRWRPLLLDHRVFWAGAQDPSTNDMDELLALLKTASTPSHAIDWGLIEGYINNHPGSGWAPALENILAEHYLDRGQFTKSLSLWESVWDTTKHFQGPDEGKFVADFALANLTRLLACWAGTILCLALLFKRKGVCLTVGPCRKNSCGQRKLMQICGNVPEFHIAVEHTQL